MAEFTQQLSGSVSTPPVINTAKQTPNVMGSIAGLARGAASVFENRERREAEEKAQAEAARAEGVRDTLAASLLRTSMQVGEPPESGAPLQLYPPVNVANTPQGQQLTRLNNAVQQGAIDYRRADVEVKAIVRNLLNEFPDQASEIHAQLKDMGFMGAITREYDLQVQQAADERALIQSRIDMYNKAAAESGIDLEGLSQSQIVEIGRQRYRSEEEHQNLVQDLNLQQQENAIRAQGRAETRFNQEQKDREIAQNTRDYTNSWIKRMSVGTNRGIAVLSQLNRIAIETGNPEDIQKARDYGIILSNDLGVARAAFADEVSRQGWGINTSAAFTAANSHFDQLEKVLTSMTTGDMTASASLSKSINEWNNATRMDLRETLPVLNSLNAVFGEQGTAIILNGLMGAEVFGEVSGIAGAEVTNLLNSVKGLAAGDPPPSWLTPDELDKSLKSAAATRTEVENLPEPTSQQLRIYGNLTLAAAAQVTSPSDLTNEDANNIINSSVHPKGRATLNKLRLDSPEEAAVVEQEVVRIVESSLNALTEDQGILRTDPTGAKKGEIDWQAMQSTAMAQASAGVLGGFVRPIEKSGISFNEKTQKFEPYGSTGRSSRNLAQTLNRGLDYIFDYYSSPGTPNVSREDIINQFVYQGRRPETTENDGE